MKLEHDPSSQKDKNNSNSMNTQIALNEKVLKTSESAPTLPKTVPMYRMPKQITLSKVPAFQVPKKIAENRQISFNII